MIIGEHIRKTHNRFRSTNDYEAYINTISMNFDSEASFFTDVIYKLDLPVTNMFNRSKRGKFTDFRKDYCKVFGNICYIHIPPSHYCFIKRINYLTGKNHMHKCSGFVTKKTTFGSDDIS